MKHTESELINAGYLYKLGKLSHEKLKSILESESSENINEAKRLIKRGITEAKKKK